MTLPLSQLLSEYPPQDTNSIDTKILNGHLSSWGLPTNKDHQEKLAAAMHVVRHDVFDGMMIGLGSGSTALLFVRYLSFHIREQGWSLQAIATSEQTHALAQSLDIPLLDTPLQAGKALDLVVDGTDEVTFSGQAIKGGGGCVLREKIVAMTGKKMVIIAGQGKLVENLGAFPLPIVIKPFGMHATAEQVDQIVHSIIKSKALSVWRTESSTTQGPDSALLVTDDGDYILDVQCGCFDSDQARLLRSYLDSIPGVVTTGLFLNIAHEMVLASSSSSTGTDTTSVEVRRWQFGNSNNKQYV